MGKGQRTLACSASQELYAQYRALLPLGPDGLPVSVNAHLTSLVEAFIAGETYPPRTTTATAGAVTSGEFAAFQAAVEQARTEPLTPGSFIAPDSRREMSEQVTTLAVLERDDEPDPMSCMHPHGLLHREGRQVVCRCGHTVR